MYPISDLDEAAFVSTSGGKSESEESTMSYRRVVAMVEQEPALAPRTNTKEVAGDTERQYK